MEIAGCLCVLILFSCDASAWSHSQQKTSTSAPVLQPTAGPAPEQKCEVEVEERVTCGPSGITAAQCEEMNCCFASNAQQCYFANAVTLHCTKEGEFVVVVATGSTRPALDMDTISLRGGDKEPPCRPVSLTAAFAIFHFPVTACGTTVSEGDDYVTYENHIISSYRVLVGKKGTITRDSSFQLGFQCQYSNVAVETLAFEANPVPAPGPVAVQGPLRVELRLASGKCLTEGCVQAEEAYRSFYSEEDYPVYRTLREELYAEVHLLERTDPQLILNLDRCWATNSTDPLSLPQWDILIDGCPYWDDRYESSVVPMDSSSGLQFPSHHKRFVLRMFAFVDRVTLLPGKDAVFIHCNTAVCYPTANYSCEQKCNRPKRKTRSLPATRSDTVSSGKVILLPTK